MGDTRSPSALSLEERNSVGVGTFQPSFGFKDFHQSARLHPLAGGRWSPETVTTSPWVGRSKSGCDLGPTLSFKDVHHPRWGGGRAEPELYLPRGFVGQPLLQHSRERALTGPASRVDFDNAGLVDGGRRQLQRVGLAGLAPSAPSCRKGGCRAVRTGGPPNTSRAARAAFVFWGGPTFAPVQRPRAEVGGPLVRGDPSEDLPVG
jgi:hypothetical protein